MTAVLHEPPAVSPVAAVQMAIAEDSQPPRLVPREWIRVGPTLDALVIQEHEIGRAEVVYIDYRRRAINDDVVWANGEWRFEHPGASGGYADKYDRLREFVAVLRRGPHFPD